LCSFVSTVCASNAPDPGERPVAVILGDENLLGPSERPIAVIFRDENVGVRSADEQGLVCFSYTKGGHETKTPRQIAVPGAVNCYAGTSVISRVKFRTYFITRAAGPFGP